MLRLSSWLWLPLLLAVSCSLTDSSWAIDPELTQLAWKLSEFPGETVPSGQSPTLRFSNSGSLEGQGTCNSFQGSFQTSDSGEFKLKIDGWTEKACSPEEVFLFDRELAEAFDKVDEYSLDDGWLLLWANGAIVLEYRAIF